METFEHSFSSIDKYLHHRKPYSLIDQIESIEEAKVTTIAEVKGNEFYVQGHFPGAPILPGAMMQEMTTQSAGILIAAKYNPMQDFRTEDPFFNEYALGVLVKIDQARYRGFARPGDRLEIVVELMDRIADMFDFRARITVAGKMIMSNRFRLANIRSEVLQGR